MKKAVKGTYGYIKTKRTFVLLRTILYFVISLALLPDHGKTCLRL